MWSSWPNWKAGWIGAQRPRMISVQAAGCAPIVRAMRENRDRAEFEDEAQTIASELRVLTHLQIA